jgi:small subunit ribosomal protein S9
MPSTKKSVEKASKKSESKAKPAEKYFQGIGRRKLSVAGAKLFAHSGKKSELEIIVNGKNHKTYFSLSELHDIVGSPLKAVQAPEISKVTVAVRGGGIRGQAEAIRLAIARALVLYNADFKKSLRSADFLTRDARTVERKKAGLKKARRAPQFSKR